jgi:hypothetical protein
MKFVEKYGEGRWHFVPSRAGISMLEKYGEGPI